ncbi:hypothetical protein LCGC14_2541470 [marine sediment metagenome]|uniref:Toprim domain-containing protein n=1 Tax=marine sediment metagenome TaxID=412755 RepID=A0A0F9AQL8_9ZZZZ
MNVERILEALGVDVTKSGASEIKARCPVHSGDDPNFNINAETGMWMCHSHCGGGNIQQLVARVLGIKSREAATWLADQGVASGWRRGSGSRLEKGMAAAEAKKKPVRACPPYDITAVPLWVTDRGFSARILKEYQCGMSRFYGALVIPVLQSRALIYRFNPGLGGTMKYKFTEGFKAHGTFYGLHNVTLGLDGSLILVEGPLDVLWLRQHGYGNSLAILGGKTLGMEQRRILKEDLKPKKLILAFDNDEAGASLSTKSVNGISKHIPCHVVQWDKVDFTFDDDEDMAMIPSDVAELTPKKIEELLATAVLTKKTPPKKSA